jgi:hypothetical protein
MKSADKKTIESTIAFLIANIPRLNKATETEIEALLDNAYRENNVDRAILQLLFVLLTLQRRGKQLSVPLPEDFQKLVTARAQARLKEMSPASRALLDARVQRLMSQNGAGSESVSQCGGDPLTIGLTVGGVVLGLSLIGGLIFVFSQRRKSRRAMADNVGDSPRASPDSSPRFETYNPPSNASPVYGLVPKSQYGQIPGEIDDPRTPSYGALKPKLNSPIMGRIPNDFEAMAQAYETRRGAFGRTGY